MKKIVSILMFSSFVLSVFSQDSGSSAKSFRFGLKAIPSVNWYKPDNQKKFETNGVIPKFGWGLQTEFKLSSVASFVTGVQVDYDGGKLKFKDTADFYFDTKDEKLITSQDTTGVDWTKFKLNERTYGVNYLTLPLYLKMKTKEIGYMTYFAEFGLNNSFRLKSRVNDNVTEYSATKTTSDLKEIENTKDMNLFRFQLHVGGGAEYNMSGSTSLFFGVFYNYGFSNVLKKESEFLTNKNTGSIEQKSYANNVALSVGILF